MKRGLGISVILLLLLSLGGCSKSTKLVKDVTSKDSDIFLEDVTNEKSTSKNADGSVTIAEGNKENTEDNDYSQVIYEDNTSINKSPNSLEENTKENEKINKSNGESLIYDVKVDDDINFAKDIVLRYATYLEDDLIYYDFVNIDNYISSEDEEVSALRGVGMYHFVQDSECSSQEFYYNPNTGDVFVAVQGLLFRLNDNKHINSNKYSDGFVYTFDRTNGGVTLESKVLDNDIN